MITRTLKHRFVRPLVYLVCALMVLAGDPLLALDQNVRVVPKDDQPDWLDAWTDGGTYRDAWDATASWSRDSIGDLEQRLGFWWDGTWEPAWRGLPESVAQAPLAVRAATGFAQQDGDGGDGDGEGAGSGEGGGEGQSLGLTEEELRQLALTDAVGFENGESVKTLPLPEIPGQKAGGSTFRPPKDLVQLMTGKATLDNIPLIPGLNLLSLPEEPASTDPATVFNAISGAFTKVWVYEHCDTANPWKIFDPNDPAGTDLTEIDHTNGFWLEATSAVDLPSDGTLPATTTIELCPGWNLIGYPAGEARHVTNALHTIEGKYIRVFGYDATDVDDPWEVYSVGVPHWANDLSLMYPGRGYWVLATEAATLTIANEGPDPVVDLISPADLDVVTDFTDVIGTVESPILESWRLTYERIGEAEPIELATGVAPITAGELATFDPTLLVNGLYELKLEATDLDGRVVEDSIAVSVEGNMKIGHFTLSFTDLAIPLSGLDIEVIRTYDSRLRAVDGDFGHGWFLDIRRGSYQNNRPPGDGWQIVNPGGPFGLPCTSVLETESHITTIRLSDHEVYRFRLGLVETAALIGGCQARAVFHWVDGPRPGSRLEILGNDYVIYENAGDRLLDQNTFQVFEPNAVKLTTRDGRIFHLDLEDGVTHLEDLDGNAVEITPAGITHSSGVAVEFIRSVAGRIQEIVDVLGNRNLYSYDVAGDLVRHNDRAGGESSFGYREHYLEDIYNADGIRASRTEYDDSGRISKVIDALGRETQFAHDLEGRIEVVTDRLGNTEIYEYDDRGNVVREIDKLGNAHVRTYDAKDRLATETDPLGHTTVNTYDAAGNLLTVTDPLGGISTFVPDNLGNPTSFTDALGRVTNMTYDDSGNLLTLTGANGATASFAYDGNGRALTGSDAAGGQAQLVHDGRGNLVSWTDSVGAEITYTYDGNGVRTSQTETRTLADGSSELLVTTYEIDALGRQVATTLPDGSTRRVEYDAVGRTAALVNELGHRTTYVYDAASRRIETRYADGTAELLSYDAEGRTTSATDRAGRVTTFSYDAMGRLLTTGYPDGSQRSSEYDAMGREVRRTDERGHATQLVYDALGRRTQVIDALGNTTTHTYDAVGNETSMTDALGRTTTYTVDPSNRRVATEWADGRTTRTDFDPAGRVLAEIDGAGARTEFAYDGEGRLTQVTDALGGTTSYLYDPQGLLASHTDANDHTTSFTYDLRGRMIARTLPDGAAESFVYDGVGNLTAHTDFGGAVTTYAFDSNRRMTSKTLPDGGVVSFTYSPTGHRRTVTDARGVTQTTYDLRDRPTSVTEPSGRSVHHAWDVAGNRTSVRVVLGPGDEHATSYTHDPLGRITAVEGFEGGDYALGYDAVGNLTSLGYPNDLVASRSYDQVNRLLSASLSHSTSGDTLDRHDYEIDAAGRRTSVREVDDTVRSYRYDELGRLVEESITDPDGVLVSSEGFSYDPVGNRLSLVTTDANANTEEILSTYDSRDRLLTMGSETLGWDGDGRLLSDGTRQFGWDSEDRLVAADLPNGDSVSIGYDPDGNKVSRTWTRSGVVESTEELVDTASPLSRLLAEISDDGATLYSHAGAHVLGAYDSATGTSRHLHGDGLGSVRKVTNAAGGVEESYSYSAFGVPREAATSSAQRFGFAGEPYEPDLGLAYHRARWMAPAQGRFLSLDPFLGALDSPVTLHRYLYAGSDPVNNIDPSGLQFSVVGISAVAAIATGLAAAGITALRGGSPAQIVVNGLLVGLVTFGVVAGGILLVEFAPIMYGVIAAVGFGAFRILLTHGPRAVMTLHRISRVSRTDARVFYQTLRAVPRGSGFMSSLTALSEAVARVVGPHARINLLGRYQGAEVYGSLVSGFGIVQANRATLIVRLGQGGQWTIYGAF